MPPVRGRQRAVVALVLCGAATASGALAGFVAGLAAVPVPPVPLWAAAAVLAVAAIADGVGRPRPVSVRRQVPQAWSRLFAPATVALLYGGRLGVGPLTVLNTWLWWAMLAIGALAGVVPAVAAAATFGLVRGVVTAAAGMWLAPSAPRRMRWLRGADAATGRACAGAALVAGAVAALA